MFKPRTEPVPYGLAPYKWDIPSVYQCVWYVFYRVLECGYSPVEWWDRATQTGSYTNAKEWLKEYRDPWMPITDPNYQPVAGDVAVFDGQYGHVQFFETETMVSEYSNGDPNSFRVKKFERKSNLLGFLHYPYQPVLPVERNTNVNQIQTTDEQLRIRVAPSLESEIVGHVQLGYYNVLSQTEADGYTWYEIAKDRWCADITTNYLPSEENDFVRQLEKFLNETKAKINDLEEENKQMRTDYTEVKNIAQRWAK